MYDDVVDCTMDLSKEHLYFEKSNEMDTGVISA
jgi:hypothetical protein